MLALLFYRSFIPNIKANCIVLGFFFQHFKHLWKKCVLMLTLDPVLPRGAAAWFRWACQSSLLRSGCGRWRSLPQVQRSWWTDATPAARWPDSWGRRTGPLPFWSRSSPAAAPAPWTAASRSKRTGPRLRSLRRTPEDNGGGRIKHTFLYLTVCM